MATEEDSEDLDPNRLNTLKARDEEIVSVLETASDTFLSTSEIAEELPIGKRATHKRLDELHERGIVEKKSIGVGSTWWLPERVAGDAADVEDEEIDDVEDLAAKLSAQGGRSRTETAIYVSTLFVVASAVVAVLSLVVMGIDFLLEVDFLLEPVLGNPEFMFVLSVLGLLFGTLGLIAAGGTKLLVTGSTRFRDWLGRRTDGFG